MWHSHIRIPEGGWERKEKVSSEKGCGMCQQVSLLWRRESSPQEAAHLSGSPVASKRGMTHYSCACL